MLSEREIRRLLWGEMPTPLVDKVYNKIRRDYKINKNFEKEKDCEEHFFKWLEKTFPECPKRRQYNIEGGRIDVIMKCEDDIVAIEIKYPKNLSQLQRLKGQADDYKKALGEKLIILLLSGKMDEYHIKNFKEDMKSKGVRVIEKSVPQKKRGVKKASERKVSTKKKTTKKGSDHHKKK